MLTFDCVSELREEFERLAFQLNAVTAHVAIETMRQKMRAGEVRPEAFLKAKEIILNAIVPDDATVN